MGGRPALEVVVRILHLCELLDSLLMLPRPLPRDIGHAVVVPNGGQCLLLVLDLLALVLFKIARLAAASGFPYIFRVAELEVPLFD